MPENSKLVVIGLQTYFLDQNLTYMAIVLIIATIRPNSRQVEENKLITVAKCLLVPV